MNTHSEIADEAHIKPESEDSPRQWIWMGETTGAQWHVD